MKRKRNYKRKAKAEPQIEDYSKFELTCLNCKETIEEYTLVKNPSVMIFDCLNCGKGWGVATTTMTPAGDSAVDSDSK